MEKKLIDVLQQNRALFNKVVPFDSTKDKLLHLNFTQTNTELTHEILADTNAFSIYVERLLGEDYTYGIGGYDEHRTVYARSQVFDGAGEPRRLHLGVDIWGPAGTQVYAPLDGVIHSYAFNNQYGDYGATIILQHLLEGVQFYSLYGHLGLRDLDGIEIGKPVQRGECIAHFGIAEENGHWPPHLHFQLIENIGECKGDYPGVCKYSERETYLANCPDPDIILQMLQYAV